jgi:hypothetical protein
MEWFSVLIGILIGLILAGGFVWFGLDDFLDHLFNRK